MLTRRLAIIGATFPLLSGCASAVYAVSYEAASSSVGTTTGLDPQDIDDLRAGRLERVRQRYAGSDPASLTPKQLLLLSDIYLKYGEFGKASTLLVIYQRRTEDHSSAVAGTQALIALALGNPATAVRLTSGADDDGSRYVRGLASARLGQTGDARATAARFALSFDPRLVYFAANLYSAVGDNKSALDLLQDPSRRLLRDYGVSTLPTLFGPGKTAPFRLDVFDEFTTGWFNVYSYAPAANVYVEYLAAHSLLELGQTQDAVQHLDALLAYPGLPAYRDVEWLVLYDRGRAAQRLGQTGDAQRYFQRSIDDIESMRRSVSSDQGRIGFAADKQAVYAAMVDLLLAAGQVGLALSYSERARSRSLVDLLASRDDIVPRELSPGRSAALLDQLDAAEGQAAIAAAAPDPAAALRASDFAAARRNIADQAPSLAPLISVTPIPVDTIRQAVGPDETAIAFYRTGSGWTAFVIGRGQVASVPLRLGDANHLVLGLLRSVTSSEDTMAHCRAAYDALIGPLRGSISTRRLLLVPFGILHYVPFAALHDGNGYLIEAFSIRQVPSLSALVVAERTPAAGSGSLIIGNPLRIGDAPPLPSAQAEAELVGTLLPNPTVLIGGAATLDAFRRDAPGKAYLHIASHGEFNATNPLGSRLLLAADPGDTGDLTVGALYSIRLGARLVTLSACETAVSELSDGDDLVGLVRGFLFAGAENVIATLWEISDRATSTLMGGFYRSLRTTQSVPESLRAAQIETMKTYPQPFYWAAFVPTSFAPLVGFA